MSADIPDTFKLRILTPEREVVYENITHATVSGLDSIVEILPGHEPILMPLAVAPLAVKTTDVDEEILFAIHGGFLEVGRDEVSILADGAERRDEINMERLQQARTRAEERLASRRDRAEDIDFERARRALLRSIARINAVEANFIE
ncbi:MAG: ATP synthase F1 subunit epsilon [Planctomycetota bacterium]|jgi:F-type H+-transporting ATPase subunit epsilon